MPSLIIRFDTTLSNGRDYFYDLSVKNTPVGYCDRHLNLGDHLWIDMFYINEEYQHDNCQNPPHYGRRFIKLYCVYARNHGCNRIDCEPNEDSKSFWHKIGFRNIGLRERSGIHPSGATYRIFRKRIYSRC